MAEKDTVQSVYDWFQEARPMADQDDLMVQTGCHFEEIGEMLDEMEGLCPTSIRLIRHLKMSVNQMAHFLKHGHVKFMVKNDVAFLDSLGDQFVTGVGIGQALKYDIPGAYKETDRSNWSKFDENGKAIFQPNGKIDKAPGYTPPDLKPYILTK